MAIMRNRHFLSGVAIVGALLSAFWLQDLQGQTKRLYRWIDETGTVHYSDKVPPDQSRHMRETLDNRGHTIAVTEAAKSREELAAEQQLLALRNAEQQLLARQIEQDKTLLIAYRREEELQAAKEARLSLLHNQARLMDNNIQRLNDKIDALFRQAADLERNGKRIPPEIPEKIQGTRNQLEEVRQKREARQQQQKAVERQFDRDFARLRALLKPSGQAFLNETVDIAYRPPLTGGAATPAIFPCLDEPSCAGAWKRTADYVQRFSTTPVAVTTDTLIYALNPRTSDDIALSASRISDPDGTPVLFLDVRCANNGVGMALCKSAKVDDIRSRFPDVVGSNPSSATHQ